MHQPSQTKVVLLMAINGMIRKTSASFPPGLMCINGLWFQVHGHIMPILFYDHPQYGMTGRLIELFTLTHFLSSCPPAALYRECSIHMSVPPVEASAFFRAPSAMGARCQCFETALQTLSKLWSVLPATRTVFSAVRAVLVRWTSHPRGHLVLLTKVSSMVYTFFF